MLLQIILIVLIFGFSLLYLNGRYNENYWKKRGVIFHKKNRVIGPFWEYFTKNRPMFLIFNDIYKQYRNEPAVAVGALLSPSLYVIDPINVQHVLQTDFNSFNHRGVESIDGDQLSDNVLFMNGARWKLMRQNMTPLFTAGKLKNMHYIMDKSAQDLIELLKKDPEKQKGNVYETLMSFCSAAIGAAVFGIDTASVFDSPFLKIAQKSFESSLIRDFKFAVANISTSIFKITRLKLFKEFEDFFVDAIKQTIDKRIKDDVKRNDFIDICISLQKNGTMKDKTTGCEMDPTVGLLAAQGFFFFIAGVEPCATVLLCTLAELGKNSKILKKVHEEIDEVFEKYNNEISYDVIAELEYLEKVMNEAMRMYPPIGYLTRQCIHDTVLPVGNIKIEKGTKIFTPIYEIHHDPKFYPNSYVFDPERFNRDSQQLPIDVMFMPFGKGNRTCIGARYARFQVKAGLVHLLRHFSIKTIIDGDDIIFKKGPVNVRPKNVDVELIPRDI